MYKYIYITLKYICIILYKYMYNNIIFSYFYVRIYF